MDNIYALSDYVNKFFQEELDKFYSFEIWKNLCVYLADPATEDKAHALFNRFGSKLVTNYMSIDSIANNDPWCPVLEVHYEWKRSAEIIEIRITIAKDKVHRVQIVDMLGITQRHGQDANLVNLFMKSMTFKVISDSVENNGNN